MKRMLIRQSAALVLLGAGLATAAEVFTINLDGDQNVPPTVTDATGTGTFVLNDAETALDYTIQLSNLDLDGNQTPGDVQDDVTNMHIHLGGVGTNGPVIFGFITPDHDLDDLVIDPVAGTLTGTWEDTDPSTQTLTAMLDELRSELLYINVHTVGFGGGEIRGQILGSSPRDVQIRSINFATGVVELHNCGLSDVALDGWQFCTQDDDQTFQYSGPGGLNGATVEAGTSFFVHYNNDAPGGPDSVNRTDLGGNLATPLGAGPAAISLYFPPVNFNDGNTMADHIQWNIDGLDDTTADERSDEAEAGGVWTDQSAWVATEAGTTFIGLVDTSCSELHGPSDYEASPPAADCNTNGQGDGFDIASGVSADANTNGIPDECEGGIPCDDVRGIRARCDAGRLRVLVRMTDTSHDGETLTVDIDGQTITRPIQNGRARFNAPNRVGLQTITLVDPDCPNITRTVDCGP